MKKRNNIDQVNNKIIKILLWIFLVLFISLIIPFYWNPFYLLLLFSSIYLFGDFMTLIILLVSILYLVFCLYWKRHPKKLFFIIGFIFLSFQLYYLYQLLNSEYDYNSFSDVVSFSLLQWVYKFNHETPISVLFSINSFGLFNSTFYVFTFGLINPLISFIITLILLVIVFIILLTFIGMFFYKKSNILYYRIGDIKITFLGSYDNYDLENIENINSKERKNYDEKNKKRN